MKINQCIRHDTCKRFGRALKRGPWAVLAAIGIVWMIFGSTAWTDSPNVLEAPETVGQGTIVPNTVDQSSDNQARQVLGKVFVRLIRGQAFDAKLQQTVWAADREVVGVGTYLQAGESTGRYRMQMKLHTGRDTHHFTQISDGRLAWIRTEIEGEVSLSRVDVSRLNQWIKPSESSYHLSAGYLAGGLVEMLDTVARDFDLTVQPAKLDGQQMIVITGMLRRDVRQRTIGSSHIAELAALQPTMVRVAIQTQDDPEAQIGKGLPVRWEYWSDPVASHEMPSTPRESTPRESKRELEQESNNQGGPAAVPSRRLISLLHVRSIRRIPPPNEVEFRYENRDANVDFINDTDRYLQRHGMQLTEAQRVQLRR